MTHQDRINLIKDGVINRTGYWADLGSGSGLFTMALAAILTPPAKIFSIDKDLSALRKQKNQLNRQFSNLECNYIAMAFEQELRLPLLDGILMANSLHYLKQKSAFLQQALRLLKPSGGFLLVEYNTDRSNYWVPHPISFSEWQKLTQEVGLTNTRLLGTQPSRYHREIYTALSTK